MCISTPLQGWNCEEWLSKYPTKKTTDFKLNYRHVASCRFGNALLTYILSFSLFPTELFRQASKNPSLLSLSLSSLSITSNFCRSFIHTTSSSIMDHETLEQQTAPESTRGLFDPPEIVVCIILTLLLVVLFSHALFL